MPIFPPNRPKRDLSKPGEYRFLIAGIWYVVGVGRDPDTGKFAALAIDELTNDQVSAGELYETAAEAWAQILQILALS
jgi:hypothetical protein